MKRNSFSVFAGMLLALLILLSSLPVSASEPVSPENALDSLLSYYGTETGSLQEWLDSGLTGSSDTDKWLLPALYRLDSSLDFTMAGERLEQQAESDTHASAVTRQGYSLALLACGRTDSPYVWKTADTTVGQLGIMSWIYGLHLMNNGIIPSGNTREEAVEKLLSLQKEDGGWAVSGNASDPDVTAMTLTALAPLVKEDAAVSAAADRALEFLSEAQLEDGGYQSYGQENAESVAQVLIALCALEIDPERDSRFIKGGRTIPEALSDFITPEGGYSHLSGGEASQTTSAQVFSALVALQKAGEGALYLLQGIPQPIRAEYETESDSEPEPENSEPSQTGSPGETRNQTARKLLFCLIPVGIALVLTVILIFRGKKSPKNYLFLWLAAGAICALILLADIFSAEEYYNGSLPEKENPTGTVTMTVRCDTVVGLSDSEYIPEDGIIFPETEFVIQEGDAVCTILTEAARAFSLQTEISGTEGMEYVRGIGYLYEFDFGDLSGWVYRVNGETPSVGCGSFTLSDGDRVEWLYTLELGQEFDAAVS